MTRGRFISFEGIDGAGKSTQHAWAVDYLRAQGRTVVATREPGGTPLGEKLRALLLSEPMNLETEALLMFAARREHIAEVIEPALARGDWVVCDRFVDASFAYQGGGRGLDWKKLESLAQWVLGDLQPDLTLIFDAPVAVAQREVRVLAGEDHGVGGADVGRRRVSLRVGRALGAAQEEGGAEGGEGAVDEEAFGGAHGCSVG